MAKIVAGCAIAAELIAVAGEAFRNAQEATDAAKGLLKTVRGTAFTYNMPKEGKDFELMLFCDSFHH